MTSQLSATLICVLVVSTSMWTVNSAAVKGRILSASRQPFYATKGAQLVQAQQQEQSQEQEAALPAFVEPPPAPAPEPDAGEPMMPYAFEYSASGPDGTGSARRESNDGQRVTGTYTLSGADGISRVVHYVADKDGYRATIITNEPGTESQSPAATQLQSSQLPAEQIALQYGPREPVVSQSPARLVAAAIPSASSGVKGAPLRAAVKTAPIVQAPIVQVRQSASIKSRPLPPPPPPAAPAAPLFATSPRAPSKTRVTLPPPPPPPPAAIRVASKTAPLRVNSKTAPIKGLRQQPFYATTSTTTTTTTTTTPAPTTQEVQQASLILDEQQQQQQQEEPQEFAQLQQEQQQEQQLQDQQEFSQENEQQQQQQNAFFSS